MQINISLKNLTKKFDRRLIFKNVNLELNNYDSIAITGKNGTGKSTLIKIIANTLNPSSGDVTMKVENNKVQPEDMNVHTGFISPYLNLYDEFTAYENLELVCKIRGLKNNSINDILNRLGLYSRRHDNLRIFSSGMKQRMKLAFAIIHKPLLLLLDEPTSNLDKEGIKLIDEVAEEQKKYGILVIATNDEHEKELCKSELNLNQNQDKYV